VASTAQQLAISFGVATSSLITGWFLGGVNRSDPVLLTAALHHAFLTLGAMTIVSSATFLGLRSSDGDNVSHHHAEPAEG